MADESNPGAVSAQIGRPARANPQTVATCHLGLPVVVRMPPLLDDGTPFPTRYWLTCPLAVRRVSRLESDGGIQLLQEQVAAEPALAERLVRAHQRYAADRDRDLPAGASPVPRGGVGGTEGTGVKCLHAHFADYAAGGDNPVGELVAPEATPLDCTLRCVVASGSKWERNPQWREPRS